MTYLWTTDSGLEVEVDRPMSKSDEQPTLEEVQAVDPNIDETAYKAMVFNKKITGGAGHIGFGQKGYWLFFLMLLACGNESETRQVPAQSPAAVSLETEAQLLPEPCTVTRIKNDILVVCPDGTQEIIEPVIIRQYGSTTEEIITEKVVEVEVERVVEVEKLVEVEVERIVEVEKLVPVPTEPQEINVTCVAPTTGGGGGGKK